MSAILGAGSPVSAQSPDAIERIKELIDAGNDQIRHASRRIENALDRALGSRKSDALGTSVSTPTPPLAARTIYDLLNEQSRDLRDLNDQLVRLQDQLP